MQVPPYGYAAPHTSEFSAADQGSLDSLAIFHLVCAALITLGCLMLLAAVVFGVAFVSSATRLCGSGIFAGGVFMVVLGRPAVAQRDLLTASSSVR